MRYEEERIQEIVVRWARGKYPELLLTCAPATAKSVIAGSRNKRMGLLKGWPDLFFAEARGGFNGLFIELKSDTGKLSPHQTEMLQLLNDRGYKAVVCYGSAQAIEAITKYMEVKK